MALVSAAQKAQQWGVSERTVRNYCARGKIAGAVLCGKTWQIPAHAERPGRDKRTPSTLRGRLAAEMASRLSGGIYHRLQIDLTYNSNHIEGSRLTSEQTRHIFETRTLAATGEAVPVDDIIETSNHFRCIDWIIANAMRPLTQKMVKHLHLMLKSGTQDALQGWFCVGDYKRLPNEVGGRDTSLPQDVPAHMRDLLDWYEHLAQKTLRDLLEFHVRFERIHPFQDGNGRIGRLILFKECLRWNIVPFIISDDLKFFYYRGLNEWDDLPGYLTDTCLAAQDRFREVLQYFGIRA